MSEEMEKALLDFFENAPANKKRYMMKDISKKLSQFNKRDLKKVVNKLIMEQKLAYWSSGSTTYVTLPSAEAARGGDESK